MGITTREKKITDCPRDLQGKAPGTSVKMDKQIHIAIGAKNRKVVSKKKLSDKIW